MMTVNLMVIRPILMVMILLAMVMGGNGEGEEKMDGCW